jgi:flagellin
MGLGLLTNVVSLEAQRYVRQTENALSSNLSRLASGLRIVHPGDDPAGLSIGSRLAAQLDGLQQAQSNAGQSLGLVQTADSGLSDISLLLTRMQELALQASNGGTLSPTDLGALNTEFSSLQAEVTRVVGATSYNGQNLIDGSLSSGVNFQVGPNNGSGNQISFALSSASANTLGVNTGQIDIINQADAQGAITALNTAIGAIANLRTNVGAADLRLESAQNNLASRYTTLAAAHSRITDVDVAAETVSMTSNSILLRAGLAVLAQANQQPGFLLSLFSSH